MSRHNKIEPRCISLPETRILIKSVTDGRHRLGLALMACAGLRVSEICLLKVKDLLPELSSMRVTGKGGRERIVPLSPFLQKEIEIYLGRHGAALSHESTLVGSTRGTWHYVIKKYSRRVLHRDDICCTTLRQSFEAALYRTGAKIEIISELMGHARINTAMITPQIFIEQKREAVMMLDDRRPGPVRLLRRLIKNRPDMKIESREPLIGRGRELGQLRAYIFRGHSVVLFGPRGCGKSMILKQLENAVFIKEYRKKASLISIILKPRLLDRDTYRKTEKKLKKLSIDELIDEIHKVPATVVIDDITELSKPDRKTISRLAEKTVVVTATSRRADVKLFRTFIEIRHLKRHYTRHVVSEMIQMNDIKKKDIIVDDILHASGDNLKEAAYISSQMQLGKSINDINTEERESNQVSIAPALLLIVLFFFSWVLKSYTTSIVAMSYAMLVVFRMIFMRFMFMPANRKRKA